MEEYIREMRRPEARKIVRTRALALRQERQDEAQRGNGLGHIRDIEECRGSTRREEGQFNEDLPLALGRGPPHTRPPIYQGIIPGSPGQQGRGRAEAGSTRPPGGCISALCSDATLLAPRTQEPTGGHTDGVDAG